MTTTHLTVGRFRREKSGPPWRSPSTGHPRSPGAAGVRCPVSVTVGIPLPYRLWSRRPGSAVPKPPPVGKGPGCWASSHSNLSFRTLSGPHNGPGDHSHPPSTPSLCTAGKWALPSTAGRGSSLAGPLHARQPDSGARQLEPPESVPRAARGTQVPRWGRGRGEGGAENEEIKMESRVLISSPKVSPKAPLSGGCSKACPGPAHRGTLLPICSLLSPRCVPLSADW